MNLGCQINTHVQVVHAYYSVIDPLRLKPEYKIWWTYSCVFYFPKGGTFYYSDHYNVVPFFKRMLTLAIPLNYRR